jgi:hypothetical protein
MKKLPARTRRLAQALAALPLLISAGLLANMAPPTVAHHYEPAEVQPIWMKIDLNGDGKISRDELREEDPRLLSRFDEADLDHDGTLSLRELEMLLLSV